MSDPHTVPPARREPEPPLAVPPSVPATGLPDNRTAADLGRADVTGPPGNRTDDHGGRSTSASEGDPTPASRATEAGREGATNVAREVRSQTSRLVGEAGLQTRDRADTQVHHLAGALSKVSDELRQMAEGTDADGYLAALVRDGATTTRQLSDRLQANGLDGAMSDVKRFARRRPVTFMAGAFVVGLGLGRVTRNADLGRIASDNGDSAPARVTPTPHNGSNR